MDEHSSHPQLDSQVLGLIRFRSRQLAGNYGFRADEAEDLRQELVLTYLRRLPRYNPERSKPCTFGRLVINRGVASLIEARTAACRDDRHYEALGDSDGEFVTTRHPPDRNRAEERRLLQAAVREVLKRLPLELQRICVLLRTGATAREICGSLQISPATCYRRLRRIREAFLEAGLGSD